MPSIESQVLNDKFKWEVRRVAAAFGVEEWEKQPGDNVFFGYLPDTTISWGIHKDHWTYISVWIGGNSTHVIQNALDQWLILDSRKSFALLARAFYRLGFEDEAVLSQLPQLTAHEKLELRLSMPRQFWPQKWLDEEANS